MHRGRTQIPTHETPCADQATILRKLCADILRCMNKIIPVDAIEIPKDLGNVKHFPSAMGIDQWVWPLSRINAFVGTNNSGKSRVLRQLLKNALSDTSCIPRQAKKSQLELAIKELRAYIANDPSRGRTTPSLSSVLDNVDKAISTESEVVRRRPAHSVSAAKDVLRNAIGDLNSAGRSVLFGDPDKATTNEKIRQIIQAIKTFDPENPAYINAVKVFVPQIRGLRRLTGERDAIADRMHEEYSIIPGKQTDTPGHVTSSLELQTGQDIFQLIFNLHNGSHLEQKWLSEYKEYLSSRFFMGEEVKLTPFTPPPGSGNRKAVHIKIGEERDRPIHELGDGLQQLIMLTCPYMLRRDSHVLMFVEEPELYLHPGFQRAIIDAWTSYEGSLQVFVSTHSPEFLDITLDSTDISVFRCSKSLKSGSGGEQDAEISVTPLSIGERPILKELGIRNSSLMLSNCTIWVEGITDRMYLRKYLELYMNHLGRTASGNAVKLFMEDVHYSFVEYSGANITHWSFLEDGTGTKTIDVDRLCGELLLVMDRDDTKSEAKKHRREKLRTVLRDDRFCPLQSREIENLLPPKAILRAVTSRIRTEITLDENIEWEHYKSVPLGTFIRDTVLKGEASPKFAADSGTIHDKVRFATDAIAALTSWDDLTAEAKALTEKIYKFIAQRNT